MKRPVKNNSTLVIVSFIASTFLLPVLSQAQRQVDTSVPLAVRYKFEKQHGFPWEYASQKLKTVYLKDFAKNEREYEKQARAKEKAKSDYEREKARAKRAKDKAIRDKKRDRERLKRDRARVKREKERNMRRRMSELKRRSSN